MFDFIANIGVAIAIGNIYGVAMIVAIIVAIVKYYYTYLLYKYLIFKLQIDMILKYLSIVKYTSEYCF